MLRSDQNADPDHEKNGREQSSMAVCCLRMVTSPDEAERFAQAQGVNTSTAARKPGYTPGFLFDSFGSGSVQTAPASACRSGLRAYAGDETAAGSSVSDQLTNILRPAGAGRKTGFAQFLQEWINRAGEQDPRTWPPDFHSPPESRRRCPSRTFPFALQLPHTFRRLGCGP